MPPLETWTEKLEHDADVAIHVLSVPAAAGIAYILNAEGVDPKLTAILVGGLPALIASLEAALENKNVVADTEMSLAEAQARAAEDLKFGSGT